MTTQQTTQSTTQPTDFHETPNLKAAKRAARALGWFSIGLGLTELLLSRSVARSVGLYGRERWIRSCGVREIVTGIGLLRADREQPWLWARVAGDGVDLATLALDRQGSGAAATGNTVALAAVAGVTAVDVWCAQTLHMNERRLSSSDHDYTMRRGLPRPVDEMRGVARADFAAPPDMAIPSALRPFTLH